MKIGDRVFVHGYIDEIRKDTVIIRNNGGYFGTIPSEVITGELPPAQPEQTDCEYCHEDSDGFVRPIEKNSHAFVSFGLDGWHIAMRATGWVGRAPIKFCPMCGRRLIDG